MNGHRSNLLGMGLTILAATACQTSQGSEKLPGKRPSAWVGDNLIDLPSPVREIAFGDGSNLGLIVESGVFESERAGSASELQDRNIPVGDRRLVTFGAGGLVAVSDVGRFLIHKRGSSAATLGGDPSNSELLILDEDSKRLAVVFRDGSISIFDLAKGTVARQIDAEPAKATDKSVQPTRVVRAEGFRALRLTGSQRIELLDLDSPSGPKLFDVSLDNRVAPVVSRDGTRIAYLNRLGSVEIQPTNGDSPIIVNIPKGPVTAIALSPDASVLAAATADTVALWEVAGSARLVGMESRAKGQIGLRFSRDGLVLAWAVEGKNQIQIWKPLGAMVSFSYATPVVEQRARTACQDTANLIRFKLAGDLFARASMHIKNSELPQAKALLDETNRTFPDFPGIATALREIKGRREALDSAKVVEEKIVKLERDGEFAAARELIDKFLAEFTEYGDFGFNERRKKIQAALTLFERASENVKKGMEIDAVLAFEAATALYPQLANQHAQYGEMRTRLENSAVTAGTQAHEKKDWKAVVSRYGDLARLRPLNAVERLRLGQSHYGLGVHVEARREFESIEVESDSYVEARRTLALMARNDKDFALALTELNRARAKAARTVELEREHAEIQELLGNDDEAVKAWRSVSQLEPGNIQPLARIAKLESTRKHHEAAATALSEIAAISPSPRPELLLAIAESWRLGKNGANALATYRKLLDLVDNGVATSELGNRPRANLLTKIRDLGFFFRHGAWVSKDQFFREQGWTPHADKWQRPEQEQLRSFAERFESSHDVEKLRSLPDEDYAKEAVERRVVVGMNRREVIRAWGYFEDQYTLRVSPKVRYEQLLFGNGRRVYMRNGVLCSWAE